MEPLRPIPSLLTRLGEAAKGLAAKLRRENPPVEPPPAMIGLPPSARGLKAIPDNIEDHAKDFATRYWEPLEAIARKRMREVGVPEDRIGMIDGDFNYRLAALRARQVDRGGVHPPTGGINLDAGIFKPGILEGTMPPEVSLMHDKSRASVNMDEIIAHEYEEGMRGSHEAAIEHAPNTKLTIKEESRSLLRAQRERSV
jgi:hypothetical protein